MNICFLIGKIVSKIEFDFVIGDNKSFKNRKISVVRFKLKLLDENVLNIIGYNNVADFCCQKLKIGENVLIQGFINNSVKIEIKNIILI